MQIYFFIDPSLLSCLWFLPLGKGKAGIWKKEKRYFANYSLNNVPIFLPSRMVAAPRVHARKSMAQTPNAQAT